jgi:hypothetical protein
MASDARRPGPLLLAACAAQLAVVAFGVWLFARDRPRAAEAWARDATFMAMARLHEDLTDAERMILFAVIQGERMHPTVPQAFRTCLDRARQDCRAARVNAALPGEAEEMEQLAKQLEVVSRRGEALLAAPASERLSRYDAPATGFQAEITMAWDHLSTVRALNMVGLENARTAGRSEDQWAAGAVGGLGGLSLLLTAVVGWRQLREARRAEPHAARDPAA